MYKIYGDGVVYYTYVLSEEDKRYPHEKIDMIVDDHRVVPIPGVTDLILQENKLLKAQLKAQTERSDFIEDCIAEMAGVVYNTEETTT